MRRKLQLKQIELPIVDGTHIDINEEDHKDANNNVIGRKLVVDDSSLVTELGTLQQNIQTVVSSVTALQSDVDQNESDADAAIAALQVDVDQNEADSDTAEATLTSNLTAEGVTARAAELANANAISAEATTARAAEQANASAISTERTRALAIEGGLRGDVDSANTKVDAITAGIGVDLDTLLEVVTAYEAADTTVIASIATLQSDVNQNEADADAAFVSAASFNLAARNTIQADIDQNESDADAAITALQNDVDQNEVDADAMDAAIRSSSGFDANGGLAYGTQAQNPILSGAGSLKVASERLEIGLQGVKGSLQTASGFDFCEYYTMVESDLNALGTTNPEIRFNSNPQAQSLNGGFVIDYDKVAPGGMSQETIKSKVLVTLNGLQLKGKIGQSDASTEYGIHFNTVSGVKQLSIHFPEYLLDGDDVVCIMVSRGQ